MILYPVSASLSGGTVIDISWLFTQAALPIFCACGKELGKERQGAQRDCKVLHFDLNCLVNNGGAVTLQVLDLL